MPPPRGGSFNPLSGPGDYTTTQTVHSSSYPAISPLGTNHEAHSILIAGASRAIALSFAKAGASQIALGARSNLSSAAASLKTAVKTAGRSEPHVLELSLDVSDESSVSAAAAALEQEFGGKLDLAVYNAGIIEPLHPILEADPGTWWKTWEVNVKGAFLVTHGCLPLLLKSESECKTLIAASSVGATCVLPACSAYMPSKTAVTRFMEMVDAEYAAQQGLIAFSVHLAWNVLLSDIVGKGEGMEEDSKAVFTETPELCGDGLVFLTNERREWLGGRYVNLTWDLPELR